MAKSLELPEGLRQVVIPMVSAWAGGYHLTLGQIKVAAKSSEHMAIPRLLELLDLQQSMVTIDAIGTMLPIARKIRSKEADYVLALKANQPSLYKDTVAYFQRCSQRGFHGVILPPCSEMRNVLN